MGFAKVDTQRPGSRFAFLVLVSVLLAVALMASGLGRPASAATPPKPPKHLRLYIFDCGMIRGVPPSAYRFKPGELATTDMAVPCYLIVDPKGTLMWDVGVIPDSAFGPDGGPVTQKRFFTATKTLKSQLAQIGYQPEDITYLAFSHYHQDHTANANEFAGSTWLVRQVERDAMFANKPPPMSVYDNYKDLKNSKTTIISRDEYDVFGDGKVIIKFAPGHTPGHQVLVLKLHETGTIILGGDLYHYPEERTTKRVPPSDYNPQQTLASREMIEKYAKKNHATLWIEHDAIANAKLKKSPDYYE